MSSVTITPPPLPSELPSVALPTEYEDFIDRRLRQTRRQVKNVDIAVAAAALALGASLFLFAAALIDHWLIVGGLGSFGRWMLWLALVGGCGAYFGFRLLPPLTHRVNPVFAASTIEHSQPSLRNSLVNFLLLRGRRRELAPPVYNALEQRAAADLSRVRVETAVDRGHLVRLCCALAAVLAAFCLYLVLSPKDPLRSAARILFPWSGVASPTRVTIDGVRPGDAAAFHGEFIAVSAEVSGLADGESPLLIFSTADGQSVNQSVAMSHKGGFRYECQLPPGKTGLQQDYKYHLAAGDCRSREYRIAVGNAPAIAVDNVVYHYPGYTGLAEQTQENQGDLRAIEGTEAEIFATANVEIKPGTAEIDLGCTGRRGLPMSAAGFKASGAFRLRFNPSDDNAPEYDCYQLRFSDLQGRENPRPARHRIEVVRDLPPDVRLLEPREQKVQVAENGGTAIRIAAEDPDFGLRRVELRAVRDDGRSLSIPPLLDKRRPDLAVPGEFQAEFAFEPAKLGLKVGDQVQYWIAAEDNKEPEANRSESEKRWIVVSAPEAQDRRQPRSGAEGDRSDQARGQGPADQRPDRPEQADQPPQDQPPEDPTEKQQSGEKSASPENGRNDRPKDESAEQKPDDGQSGQPDGENNGGGQSASGSQNADQKDESRQDDGEPGEAGSGGQSSDQTDRRIDPQAEPGDAMQKILDDLKQQQSKQGQDDQPPAEKQSAQEKPQTADNQSTQEKSQTAEKQTPDSRQQAGEQSSPDRHETGQEQPSGENQQAGQPGEKHPGGKKPDAEKSPAADSKPESGEKEPGGEKASPGDETPDNADEKQPSTAEKSDAEKAGVEKSSGKPDDAEKQAEEKKTPGDDLSAAEKSGSKNGDHKPAPEESKPPTDDRAPGERPSGERDSPAAEQKPADGPGSPLPQEEAPPAGKQRPDKPGQAPGERNQDDAQSPSKGTKESDANSDTAGDRKGEGEKGGGQQSDQPGIGGSGTNTPADQGASQADETGEGEAGPKPGADKKSADQTGSDQKTPGAGNAPDGADQNTPTDGRAPDATRQTDSGETSQSGTPPDDSDKGGIPTGTGGDGKKGLAAGGSLGKESDPGGKTGQQREGGPGAADRENLDYARRQTELALEHLRDQLAKEKPELLDRLGWSKEEARQFLAWWNGMRRAAETTGPAGEAAKQRYDDALKSLGFSPRGTELKHGGVETERSGPQRDAARFAPPRDWAEQFRAYTRGISAGEPPDDPGERK